MDKRKFSQELKDSKADMHTFSLGQGCAAMLKNVHNVGVDMLLCTRVILNFSMAKNEINL
jgi:hypothetical protein